MTAYRATIVRDTGVEEDWGFTDIQIRDGVVALAMNHGVNWFIAAGAWREIRDVYIEED